MNAGDRPGAEHPDGAPGPVPEAGDGPREAAPFPRSRFPARLLTRLLVPYTLLIVAAFSIAGWLIFRTAASTLDESLSTRLVGHAQVMAGKLKPVYLKVLGPGDESTQLYRYLMGEVSAFRDESGVDDVFVLDREGRVILDAKQEARIGEPYLFMKVDKVELERVWEGGAAASTLYHDDSGALYKSGYAPVRDEDGKVIAAVGVEAGAEFLAAIDRLRRSVALLVVAAIVMTVVVSVGVSRSIVGPLKKLVAAFGRVRREGEYPAVAVTTHDELGYLAQSFNDMIGRLREKDTELKRLYERERDRAERIQGMSDLILEGVPNGVIAVDRLSRVLLCNRAAARILALDADALPGSGTGIPPRVGEVLGAESPLTRCLMSSLTEKKEYLREDVRWRTGDGHERILGISAFPLADRENRPFGAIAIFSDLTELVRLQDQIKIQERLAALGEMSAGIAHEIRNPLAAIRGFVELLGRRIEDPAYRRTVESILQEILSLDQIVSDFLAFAREPSIQPEETEPGALLTDALALALPPEDRGGVEARLKVDPDLPHVLVDRGAVKKALVNIMQNGANAMADSGGTLTVEAVAEDDGVAFRIRDTGPGIAPEVRDKIFNPFFTTRPEGTGLGLPIANKVVEGHGGHIRVENGEHGGAVFTLWFPRAVGTTPAAGRTQVGEQA
jgi:PAS domain S-box-containing protein